MALASPAQPADTHGQATLSLHVFTTGTLHDPDAGTWTLGEVLRHLVSSNFISYNKEKPPILCHAFQLDKHVSLPFVSSSTMISSCFDIIHSDVWTSPILSLSANGSTQLEGVDVDETFSLVVKPAVSLWALTGPSSLVSAKKYDLGFLDRAHMANCNPSRTPIDSESKLGSNGDPVSDPTLYRSLAGSLQHLTFTRPDISYAVQQVCLYMHDPREPYFLALNRILRYVHGTLDYGLQLFSSSATDLVAYSDADWAGFLTTRRSTSGCCVFFGNNLLSWSSKRQPTLSYSSGEAEYCGVANTVAEICWSRNLLRELHTPLSSATLFYCDNVSAVYLSSNPVHHQYTKHIEIDIHFVRDLVAASQTPVLHVPSRY
nr:ribonuclease H-like domain-containing protein [Tanacetum cinerariifolium]